MSPGLATWSLEYRRVGGGGGWPETFLDVAAGVDLLSELDPPLDLIRVVAVGHSAGGHLAFSAAARSTLPPDAPGDPSERGERYELASPRARLPLRVAQLVLHGDHDETVSMRIATSYASAAREAEDPCELRVLDETGDFEHIDVDPHAWQVARDWLVDHTSAERS